MSALRQPPPALLVGLGLAAIAAAFGAELAGVGQSGFGPRSFALTAAGLLLAAAGAFGGAAALRPPACILLCAWCGLATGLLEVAHQGVRKLGFGVLLKLPVHFVWMVPLCYVVLFAALGVALALLGRLWRRAAALPVAVFACALLAAWSQTLLYTWHPLAVLLLCAGIAVQAARAAAARPAATLALSRRSAPWLAGLVLLAGAAVPLGRAVGESRALAALPPAPERAPNVLLLVLDTVRADHLGFHGYGRATTPHLDRLAASGVVFESAWSTAPWTLPSHATMFTGRYPHELSADWLVPLDEEHETLAEAFAARGYATAGFVGNLRYCAAEFGIARGFAHYDDWRAEPLVLAYSSAVGDLLMKRWVGHGFHTSLRNDADEVTEAFLRWRTEAPDRPFFAFLNYYDAHAYFTPPPPFAGRFGPGAVRREDWDAKQRWKGGELDGFVNDYDACIAFIDAQIRRLLEGLEAAGVRDETLVVLTADHGEQLGEHGLTGHGNSLYAPLLHAPLVLSWPGHVPAGVRVPAQVSLRDLPATLLDVAGAADAGLPGRSLAPFWGDPGAPFSPSPACSSVSQGINTAAQVPISRGDMHSLVAEGMHLIRNGDGVLELYDLRSDSGETRDLIDEASMRDAADRLRGALDQAVQR